MSIVVRPATPADVAQMHDMILELAIFEKEPDAVIATEEDLHRALFGGVAVPESEYGDHDSMEVARDRADTPSGQPAVFAHVIDDPDSDGLAGMAIWFLNYSTWEGRHGVYLEDLYVRPQFRGQGYGKALMSELAKICKENNYTRFQWWVLTWNQQAIDVYEKLGAVAQDEWMVYRLTGDSLDELGS